MRSNHLEKDIEYLLEMLYYIGQAKAVIPKALRYGIPLDDDMVIDSLVMNIGQIGEQLDSRKLSNELCESYPEVPWKQIKGFRNLVFHSYSSISSVDVIKILKNDIPLLEEQLNYILKEIRGKLDY